MAATIIAKSEAFLALIGVAAGLRAQGRAAVVVATDEAVPEPPRLGLPPLGGGPRLCEPGAESEGARLATGTPPPTRADGERAEGGVPEASEVGDGLPLFGPEARRLQARLA